MRSMEILSRIGQDFGRVLYNNGVSLEVLNDPKIKPKNKDLNRAEITIRQDLHDSLATCRDLAALLHLVIKDFPVTKQEMDNVATLIQPDELNELPTPNQEPEISCSETDGDSKPTDEYFSQINTNQMKNGVHDDGKTISGLFPYVWKRLKSDLNMGNNNETN